MSSGKIQAGSCSIIGDRITQQDAMKYMYSRDAFFAIVCDGMGGMSGGELASACAVRCMFERFQESEPSEENYSRWMLESFAEADRRVYSIADQNGNLLGAGSTIVSAIVRDNRFYWGSVGDSRIFYLGRQGIQTLNRDHNYHLRINEMIANNEMTEEQAAAERAQGEALISFLGAGGLSMADASEHPLILQPDDTVILCSDGLYKSLNGQQIQAITEESGGNMEIAARRLCETAYRLAPAKQDNTTVIAFRYM